MNRLIKTRRTGSVATLVLNRPARHNSLVPELLAELLAELQALAVDDTAKAVVLAAEGKSFSTGGDVKAFFSAGDDVGEFAAETVGLLNNVIMAMIELPQPIVVAVHGMVTGGSLGLVLAADVVVMDREATITPWYSVVGFAPDGGWTAMLPDLIGKKRAANILLRNRTICAEQAASWGIADDVVDEDVAAGADAIAQAIAEMVPGAVTAIKRHLGADHLDIAARLEEERQAFIKQVVTQDARRGMANFLGRPR